jgi:hypothetical protein
MELPIKFSAETQVILDDVAGYQAMSPQERVEVLKRILREGAYLISISPHAAEIRQYFDDQAELQRRNILEFLARHGCAPTKND